MFLIDTNVVSELRRPRPHRAVVDWINGIADYELYLSVVTLAEIQVGIEMTRDQDASKASEIENWLDQVSRTYNVLPMDAQTFRLWAKLMHRQSDTVYEDAMIAATAIVHQLTVMTRNVRDFERFQVSMFNQKFVRTKQSVATKKHLTLNTVADPFPLCYMRGGGLSSRV